ncbi:hypothetical protein TRVA0_045S00892 [Trichomonascus vanleenenianus]|uniref:uncharacterized protein n=1 Tax=Trichomonascus vanleenenianus TaxID=2268995 RepID=UPI003ECA989F
MKVSNTILVSWASALLSQAAPTATEAATEVNALEAKPINQELFFGGGGHHGGHHHHDCYYDDYYDDGWAVKRDAVPPEPSAAAGTPVAAAAVRSSDQPADIKINFKYKAVDDETYHNGPHYTHDDNHPYRYSHEGKGRHGRHGHVMVPALEGDYESTADAFWNQDRSNAFVLEVRQPRHYLNGNMIFSRADGTLTLQDHGLGHFVGVIGEETEHLFNTKVQKPIGIVGALNTLQVVGDMRYAARPWSVSNGVLTVNGESHAVACPTDPEQTYFQLHWGDETLCPGGIPLDLVTRPANHESPSHRHSAHVASHHAGPPSYGHSGRYHDYDREHHWDDHRRDDKDYHHRYDDDDEDGEDYHHRHHDDDDDEDWKDRHHEDEDDEDYHHRHHDDEDNEDDEDWKDRHYRHEDDEDEDDEWEPRRRHGKDDDDWKRRHHDHDDEDDEEDDEWDRHHKSYVAKPN